MTEDKKQEGYLIKIAKAFTNAPGATPETSGDIFRKNFLEPKMEDPNIHTIIIDMDGVFGYNYRFLADMIVPLVAKYGKIAVMSKIKYISKDDPDLIDTISSLITRTDTTPIEDLKNKYSAMRKGG